jgi:sugar lactone lactonase YvrE
MKLETRSSKLEGNATERNGKRRAAETGSLFQVIPFLRIPSFGILLLAFSIAGCRASELACDGVLGNSGEQGQTLVRFGSLAQSMKGPIGGGTAAGIGVVCDRFGSLWDRGGEGTLNRYARDGRLLAQYRVSMGIERRDQLTIVGDTLVLQLGCKLYTLPVGSPANSEVKPLGRDSECISFGSAKGEFASCNKGEIVFVNAETGQTRPAGKMKDVHFLEMTPDGGLFVAANGKMTKLVDGNAVTEGWPRNQPGERPQFLDGFWFGHAWHGTIRRFDAELDPAPGVVLGGASGSFIGHLDQNGELSNGRGMAKLRENLYAVSGFGGTMHLLEWDASKQQFRIIRRIGAAPYCKALGLDAAGNVWWHYGAWKWTDKPDTPIELGINSADELGQAVMLDGDEMVAPGWMWGKCAFYYGKLTGEVRTDRIESGCSMKKGLVGSAVYRSQNKLLLLTIDSKGDGRAFVIGGDGKYQSDAGAVALKTATPVKEWTTLAFTGGDARGTLLGAGDGAIIEFAADGNDWKETKRWSSWGDGAGEKFGARIFITADGGRLWVSDTQRNRVIVFDAKTCKPLAAFGTLDKAGTDLNSLAAPQMLAARGSRCVVHDGGNQRLLKLTLR